MNFIRKKMKHILCIVVFSIVFCYGSKMAVYANVSEDASHVSYWTKEKSDNFLISEAQEYFNKNLYDQANNDLEKVLADKAVKNNRYRALAFVGLASGYIQKYVDVENVNKNRYLLKAKKYFNNALWLLKPSDNLSICAYSGLGFIYYQLKDDRRAIIYLKRGLKLSLPNCRKEFVDINTNLGYVFIQRKDFIRAIKYFEQALKLSPQDPLAIKHINNGLSICSREVALRQFMRYGQKHKVKKYFYYLDKQIAIYLIILSIFILLIYYFLIRRLMILIKREFFKDLVYLTFLLSIFMLLTTIHLESPGFGDEEAFLIEPAVSIVKNTLPAYISVNLFKKNIFVMICPWTGPFSAFLFLPSAMVFGFNFFAMRITRIFYGFIMIVVLYYFTKYFFNKTKAKIISFLSITFPYYIFLYRHGYLDDGILPLLLLASLFCFYLFYKKNKIRYLYVGSFFCGLGVISKLNFAYYLIALILSSIFLKVKLKLKKYQIFLFAAIFLLTCAPLFLNIILNYKHSQMNTINHLVNNMVVTPWVNNLKFFQNFSTNFNHLKYIFSNNAFMLSQHSKYAIFINNLYFPLLIFSLLFYVLVSFNMKENNKKNRFILSLVIIMLILKNFTISLFRIEHFTILLPLLMIIITDFIYMVMKKISKKIGYVIIIVITILNLLSLIATYSFLYKTETSCMYDWSHPSTSVYKLVDYLLDEGIHEPISVDFAMCSNLRILSKGRIQPIALRDDLKKMEEYISLIENTDNHYIARLDPYYKKFFDRFLDFIKEKNRIVVVKKTFTRKDGLEDIIVFKLIKKPK